METTTRTEELVCRQVVRSSDETKIWAQKNGYPVGVTSRGAPSFYKVAYNETELMELFSKALEKSPMNLVGVEPHLKRSTR